ncbi:hypothetical protein BC826DRAFT_1189277 [Russula brevipes]|nr:hypothetical protein BC826DRAFT_1189277 [Russula brevipes]
MPYHRKVLYSLVRSVCRCPRTGRAQVSPLKHARVSSGRERDTDRKAERERMKREEEQERIDEREVEKEEVAKEDNAREREDERGEMRPEIGRVDARGPDSYSSACLLRPMSR